TRLLDDPNSSLFSCGVSREFNVGDVIAANPVPGANRYQWRFEQVGDAFVRQIAKPGYVLVLNWGTLPLTAGATYDVTVRVSFDNGANWCPFGDACEVSIVDQPQARNLSDDRSESSVNIWPNPNAGDRFFLDMEGLDTKDEMVTVEVHDLTGKRMLATELATSEGRLNTVIALDGALAKGMYLVSITTDDQRFTERLLVH
ncbi:MAG: T9SS type A sorting domain-containing protein, partial [Flavobacteriales bacterium]|nr:T9SS type A sorting domain-containing protein [Flavobacteriales bacterium]